MSQTRRLSGTDLPVDDLVRPLIGRGEASRRSDAEFRNGGILSEPLAGRNFWDAVRDRPGASKHRGIRPRRRLVGERESEAGDRSRRNRREGENA